VRDVALVFECGRLEVDIGRRELRAPGVQVPLRGRAFEIIEILVRSAGRLVTREELMHHVWPGAAVDVNTLDAHVSAVRKAFGPDRALLKTSYGRGYTLLGTWTARQGDEPALPEMPHPAKVASQATTNNLPFLASALIGRTGAVEAVCNLVPVQRMVTLTGLGGIGKTRLALEVAHTLAAGHRGDVWLVELASVSDPSLVPSALAGAAGLIFGREEISAPAVARMLANRPFLLVLDNCEHVIDAAAELVEAIMRACPHALVLATSREALRIDGEHVFHVPPLNLPPEAPLDIRDASESSAVHLFVDRMGVVDSPIKPNADDIAIIGAICRRLDGIPLAIELAAGRAQALTLAQILAYLDDRFRLLTVGSRTANRRHRTLRTTLDWSYELLTGAEQRCLRFAATFSGGFTLDAITHVLVGPDRSFSSVLNCVTGLVAKSLLSVDSSGALVRWRMLETVRAYALDRLSEDDELQQAARLHADYYRRLVAEEEPKDPAITYAERLRRLARELDNVRAALDWSFSPNGEVTSGIALTGAYVPVWFHLALLKECRERAERALDRLEAQPTNTDSDMQLRLELALALFHTVGFTPKAGRALTKVLDAAEPQDDPASQLRALWAMWTYQLGNGKHRAAKALATRFSRTVRYSSDPADLLMADRLLGVTLHYGGDQSRARLHLQRFVDLYAAPADQRHLRWFQLDQRLLAQAVLARVLWLQGFLDDARQHGHESVRGAQAVSDKLAICYVLATAICPIALMTGDFATVEAGLVTLKDLGYHGVFWTRWGVCLEGSLLIQRGESEAGVQLLTTALASSDRGVRYPEFLGFLAEGLARIGRAPEALDTVDRALKHSDRGGQRWCVARLLRIKGEVMLQDRGTTSEAEVCFERAGYVARQQGAACFELQAALSLARLQASQGRLAEAQLVLTSVCERLTQRPETADVFAARRFLAELSASHPPAL
jgi:predicted ATPase/DNA-binding winged helix-turn-helix (wHTH) protein